MSLQARFVDNTPLYNPGRDVAHNFVAVATAAADRLENAVWPELDTMLQEAGVSDMELGRACGSYCEYIAKAKTEPDTPMEQAMRDSGFFDCHPVAQVAVMATIGAIFTGIQHAGVREATINGSGPAMTTVELLEVGERAIRYMSRPRWYRRVCRMTEKFLGLFRRK